MELIHETHNRRLSWQDDQQTILLVDVFAAWTWQEAASGTEFVANVVENHHLTPYVVYQFANAGGIIPKNLAITHITKLIRTTLQYDNTVIFINPNPLLKSFIELSGLTTRIKMNIKLHFVDSLEDALQVVQTLKQEANEDPEPSGE